MRAQTPCAARGALGCEASPVRAAARGAQQRDPHPSLLRPAPPPRPLSRHRLVGRPQRSSLVLPSARVLPFSCLVHPSVVTDDALRILLLG